MNSLSWFIYAVQLVDNLSTVCVLIAVGSAGLFVGRLIATFCRSERAYVYTSPINRADLTARQVIWDEWKPKVGLHVTISVLFILFAAALPSRQTMILIAGSEMGERVVKSEAVQSIVDPGLDLVKTWIKEETEKLKPKTK